MKSYRPALLLGICAVIFSTLLLFFVYRMQPHNDAPGFVILSLPENVEEEPILRMLENSGFSTVISESRQWVFIDDFGEPIQVPLNRYRDYIESFDPRDDGYADRLMHVFHEEGRRRIILPLDDSTVSLRPHALKKRLESIAGELDPHIQIVSCSVPLYPRIIMISVAVLILLLLSKKVLLVLSCFPVYIGLGLSGAAGIASLGLLTVLLFILEEPLREFFRRQHMSEESSNGYGLSWYKRRFMVSFFLLVLYAGLTVAARMSVLVSILALVSQLAIQCTYVCTSELRSRQKGHTRFIPLHFWTVQAYNMPLLKYVFLFSFAGLLLCGFNVLFEMPLTKHEDAEKLLWNSAPPITREEYLAHLEYQQNFSISSLWAHDAESVVPYKAYRIDENGLIISDREIPQYGVYWDLSVPPVEKILGLDGSIHGRPAFFIGEALALIILTGISGLAVFRALPGLRHKRLVSSLIDKRIAA